MCRPESPFGQLDIGSDLDSAVAPVHTHGWVESAQEEVAMVDFEFAMMAIELGGSVVAERHLVDSCQSGFSGCPFPDLACSAQRVAWLAASIGRTLYRRRV